MKKALVFTICCFSLLNSYSQKQPEFFGRYILNNDSLIEIPSIDIKLQSLDFGNKPLPVFSTLPNSVIEIKSIMPSFIYYDQSVTTNTVCLTNLFIVPKNDGSICYAPVGKLKLKIKPLDKQGMFFFKPDSKLQSGYYALYGGDIIGFGGATSGNIAVIKVTHPLEKQIYSIINDLIQAIDSKDYSTVAKLTYKAVDNKSVANTEEDAKKIKRTKIFASKVIPTSILEETGTEGETYYRVDVALVGAPLTIQIGDITIGDAKGTCMFVSNIDGNLRVWTKPNENGFIFQVKK